MWGHWIYERVPNAFFLIWFIPISFNFKIGSRLWFFFCILSKSGSLSITDYNYSNWLQIQVPESIPLMNTCYLADSILLNNKTFYSVYTSYYGSAQTGLDKVYFKMDLGIIGFQTEDSSVWVLSQWNKIALCLAKGSGLINPDQQPDYRI